MSKPTKTKQYFSPTFPSAINILMVLLCQSPMKNLSTNFLFTKKLINNFFFLNEEKRWNKITWLIVLLSPNVDAYWVSKIPNGWNALLIGRNTNVLLTNAGQRMLLGRELYGSTRCPHTMVFSTRNTWWASSWIRNHSRFSQSRPSNSTYTCKGDDRNEV